jgi:ubiquinol-cytochrome c reductase cytochrome b/c1 subunit
MPMNKPKQRKGIVAWIDHRLPIFSFLRNELDEYPTPRNLNYLWNFGSLAGIVLVIMIDSAVLNRCPRVT